MYVYVHTFFSWGALESDIHVCTCQWPVFKDEGFGVFGDFLASPAPPSPHSYPVIAKI